MPPRQETPVISTAFQLYFNIGPKRSLEKLHTLMSQKCPKQCPKYRTLKSWSQKYQWQERLQIQEKAVSEGVAQKAITANIGQRAKLINQTQAMIDKCFDEKEEPKIIPKKVRDYKELVETMLKLIGEDPEPTKRHEIKIIRVKGGEE